MFSTRTFWQSPFYAGNPLTFTATTNVLFDLLGMTLNTKSHVVEDPLVIGRVLVTGLQGFFPTLYTYRLKPQGFSTIPLVGFGNTAD